MVVRVDPAAVRHCFIIIAVANRSLDDQCQLHLPILGLLALGHRRIFRQEVDVFRQFVAHLNRLCDRRMVQSLIADRIKLMLISSDGCFRPTAVGLGQGKLY